MYFCPLSGWPVHVTSLVNNKQVVDGSVGRNAVLQAETWRKNVGVSGLIVTKLDGTARG